MFTHWPPSWCVFHIAIYMYSVLAVNWRYCVGLENVRWGSASSLFSCRLPVTPSWRRPMSWTWRYVIYALCSLSSWRVRITLVFLVSKKSAGLQDQCESTRLCLIGSALISLQWLWPQTRQCSANSVQVSVNVLGKSAVIWVPLMAWSLTSACDWWNI